MMMSRFQAVTPTGQTVEFPDEAAVTEVDVREDLRQGREPFGKIMAAVQALPQGNVMLLRATFAPTPLLSVLAEQGFVHHLQSHAEDDWSVWFWRPP